MLTFSLLFNCDLAVGSDPSLGGLDATFGCDSSPSAQECAKDPLDHVSDDPHSRLMHSSRGDSNTVGVGRRLLSLRQKQAVSLSHWESVH